MTVSVRQLEVFRAVAAELHFGRAGARLQLSQPTVSKELAQLERSLGVELFYRSNGGTSLTPEGAELLPYAHRALDALGSLAEAASSSRRRRSREVRVAASPSIVNGLMPLLLRHLERSGPQLTVVAVEVDTGGVTAALEAGTADLGLGHYVAAPAHGHVRTIGRDELYLIAAASLIGPGDAARLERLAHVPLLMWPREQSPVYHDALLAELRSRGLDPLQLLGSSRLSGSRSYLLRDGRAFALAPRDFAVSEGRGLRALPLSPPAHVPLDIAWVDPLPPAARSLMAQIRAILP
jgi:DNA-binding transcriptional LysR family regulator